MTENPGLLLGKFHFQIGGEPLRIGTIEFEHVIVDGATRPELRWCRGQGGPRSTVDRINMIVCSTDNIGMSHKPRWKERRDEALPQGGKKHIQLNNSSR